MDQLVKASERATAAKELAERGARDGEPEPVIERLIELCRSQIPALSVGNPSLRRKCIELLKSDKMGATISIQGDTSELVKRVFSNIDFAIEVFSLSRNDVFPAPSLGAPETLCCICSCSSSDTDNPIIICDAATECTGGNNFHIRCLNILYVPNGDWLCYECIKSGFFIISKVIDKKVVKNETFYLVSWVGFLEEPTWQRLKDIPPGSRIKINDYNAHVRAISSQCVAASVGTPKVSPQSYIGQLIARRFDGQLFAGYVTLYYPAEGEQIADLWHIEYEDGDEEDLNYDEVLQGIQQKDELVV